VGKRTTHRVHCLVGDRAWDPAEVAGGFLLNRSSQCLVPMSWWRKPWLEEMAENRQYPCCEHHLTSNYSVPKLHKKAALGLKLAFVLAGGGLRSQRGSGVQPIDALSESSGGNALLAALGLCAAIDVYGAGLLRADLKEMRNDSTGTPRWVSATQLIYSHFYDGRPGRCSTDQSSRSHDRKHGCHRHGHCRRTRQEWRRARVEHELLLHTLHAFGVIRWVQ